MNVSFDILKNQIAENVDVEELASKIAEEKYNKEWKSEDIGGWQIKDIVENDDKFIIEILLSSKAKQIENVFEETNDNNVLEEKSQDEILQELKEQHDNIITSIVNEGPLSEKTYEVGIAHMVAFFELTQFTQFLITQTQIVSPSAARSLAVCQKFLVDLFTNYQEEAKKHGIKNITPDTPLKIQVNEDFAKHLLKWQEESIKLYEKIMKASPPKPKVQQVTMMPSNDFDPKGPPTGQQFPGTFA